MPLSVVLDTSVLYPFHLRDTLLRCAEEKLYQPLRSSDILVELRRNLVTDAWLPRSSVERLVNEMTKTFPSSLVTGYEAWLPHMANDPDDRHVLGVAVQSRAARIVTSNLRHFPPMALAPFEIIAQSPDDFLRELVDADSELVKFLIHRQAAAYRKPAMSVPELLARLEATVPEFAGQMRSRFLVDQL